MRKAVLITVATVVAMFVSCYQPDAPREAPATDVGESPYVLKSDSEGLALFRVLFVSLPAEGSSESFIDNARAICESEYGTHMKDIGDPEDTMFRLFLQTVNDIGKQGVHINFGKDAVYMFSQLKDGSFKSVSFSSAKGYEQGVDSNAEPEGSF